MTTLLRRCDGCRVASGRGAAVLSELGCLSMMRCVGWMPLAGMRFSSIHSPMKGKPNDRFGFIKQPLFVLDLWITKVSSRGF